MAPYEAVFGRRCISPINWIELGESALIGLDSVVYAMEKVQDSVIYSMEKLQLIKDRLKQPKVIRNLMQM